MNRLLNNCYLYLKNNPQVSGVEIRNKLELYKKAMLNELENSRYELAESDYEKIVNVAMGSTDYNKEISDIFRFLDKGQKPSLLKSDIDDIDIEYIDGLNLNKISIVSNLFTETSEYSNIDIICLYQPVNRFQELTQLLRKVQQTGKTTILFYNQLSVDILENILFNYSNGAIKLIPVCVSGYGKGAYTMLNEISKYTGSNVIDDTNVKIHELNKIVFGTANYVTLDDKQILIKKDNADNSDLKILDTKSVIVKVGGSNVVEREEKYRRIEDAISSLATAIEYGTVPGGGITYIKLANSVVGKGLFELEFDKVIVDTMSSISYYLGKIVIDNNVWDSAMVTREVINNSFSIVGQVLTTKALVHEDIR